ncbi:acetyl-CoA carboxylase biotin carboxyl carrier protein subunit [Alkalihalobacterium alkalinitrilicum]|uniref:acetyl-CoA carboxylase biotin carboxyl carrier protein subunit n=1 Tax=Alkalihalobacterium alkalinitrilicum TaxID=427920 RepID=UPI0009954048|nr:acetyl-CoA carboxylase biotin carboxyl carrier protein subunit [Alkalihalobacterium alkalinitrilicum]
MSEIVTNMAANVWKILINEGDQIEDGQEIAIMESMKMEIPVIAEESGVVKEIKVKEGDFVNDGDVLLILE